MKRMPLALMLASLPSLGFTSAPPVQRDVTVAAADGAKLAASLYTAAQPGPGVLLLHMCNSDRRAWEPLGHQLAAAGIHVLAVDYRGYGQSTGQRFQDDPRKRQQVMAEKWPGDLDAALAFLVAQPGVDATRVGAGGGSCGVDQAVQLARRQPAVRSLVLLAGGTNRAGLDFLRKNPWLPILTSAAADDPFDADAPRSMKWLTEMSENPRSSFVGFPDGRHGTEIFAAHPELLRRIVGWYVETLVKSPADPRAEAAARPSAVSEFWALLEAPGGAARAADFYRQARQRDPQAFLFPERALNVTAYELLQAGHKKDAIELCKLNTEAYPSSANTYDSLADAYLADGQNELALAAAKKALEVLPADTSHEEFKKQVRASAEQKLQKLAPAAK